MTPGFVQQQDKVGGFLTGFPFPLNRTPENAMPTMTTSILQRWRATSVPLLLAAAAGHFSFTHATVPVLTGDPVQDHPLIESARGPEEAITMLPDDLGLAADIVQDWLARDMDSRVLEVPRGADIIRVGGDDACDFSSPRAAAFAAPDPPAVTIIRIATNREYSGTETRIRIEDKDVILEGGYANCSASTPTEGRTTIDTSGGRNRPVVRIRNEDESRLMQVELRRLVLTGGTTTTGHFNCSESDRNGAGINIRGQARVELVDTIVIDNATTSGSYAEPPTVPSCPVFPGLITNRGGGIYINGEFSDNAELILGAGSAVLNNETAGTSDHEFTTGHGGGVFCRGGARVTLEQDATIAGNRTGGQRPGSGGGLRVGDCHLLSRAGRGLSGIFLNEATTDGETGGNGGGVWVSRTATFEPGPDGSSPVVVSNTSQVEGGGIYVASGETELVSANISNNSAGGAGGGVFVAGGNLDMRRGSQVCAGTSIDRCSRVENNGAEGHGGAFAIQSGGIADISQTTISGNYSVSGLGSVAHVRGADTELRMEGVAIHGNHSSSRLFQIEDSTVRVFWSTIAGNRRSEDPPLQVFRVLDSGQGNQPFLNVQRSIVFEPAASALVNATGDTRTRAFCTIAHAATENQFDETASFSEINARLENAGGGDLRLQDNSPAIDYCGPGGSAVQPRFDDLYGNPRGVPYDQPTISPPNPGNGDFDLGVHERQPSGVDPQADLRVTKVVEPSEAEVGELVTFTVTVANLGPDDATVVVVTDQVPDGYTLDLASIELPPGTSYDSNGRWKVGDLAAGEDNTLILRAFVNPQGDYLNVATVEGDEDDPNPGNNEASAAVTPLPPSEDEVFEDRFEVLP